MESAASSAAQPLWKDLQARMREWTRIVLSPRNADSALRTLGELAAARGEQSADYLHSLLLARREGERQKLIERLSVGTTWFMREVSGIDALASALVRELGPGGQVRVWSAGCSTGQEPYTLAMALLEAGLQPQILATDINQEALRVATAAVYPVRLLTALPAKWQQRYVTQCGPEHGLIQTLITSLVRFATYNLGGTPRPPAEWSAFDAVVCRNVLMYFDHAHATEAVRRLASCCRPGGYVLLSAIERPLAWMTDALHESEKQHDVVLLRRAWSVPAGSDGERPVTPSPPPAAVAPVPASATKTARAEAARLLVPAERSTDTEAPVTKAALAEAARLLESADLVRSLQLLDDLLAGDPLLATAHLLRGLVLKRSGALAAAAAALRCARFLFSDEAWMPPYHLALVLEQLGEPQEAFAAYRHAQAVVTAGGRSGLYPSNGAEEALAFTIAEACAARLRALAAGDPTLRLGR